MSLTPRQITQEDIDRSSTLEPSDLGRWYLVLNGAIQFFSDEDAARDMAKQLTIDADPYRRSAGAALPQELLDSIIRYLEGLTQDERHALSQRALQIRFNLANIDQASSAVTEFFRRHPELN